MTGRRLPRTKPELVATFRLPDEWSGRSFAHLAFAEDLLFAGASDVAGSPPPVRTALVAYDLVERRERYRVRIDDPIRRSDPIAGHGEQIVTTVHDRRGIWLLGFRARDGAITDTELLRGPGEYENDSFHAMVRPAPGGFFVSWSYQRADDSPRIGETQRRTESGEVRWSVPGYAKLATHEAVIVEDPKSPVWSQMGIEPETGAVLWRAKIPEPFFYGLTGGHIVAGPDSLKGPVRGIDPRTGSVAWTAELGGIASAFRAFDHVALVVSRTESHRFRLHRLAPGGDEIASGFLDGPPGEFRATPYFADEASIAWLAQRESPFELVCESLPEPGAILWRLPATGFSIAFAGGFVAVQDGREIRLHQGDV